MAPGFKCIEGRAGESGRAEQAERRADFPPELLERAEVLLGDDERRLATLARDLDKARESAEAAEARAVEALASAREAEARAEERFLAVEAEAKKKAALKRRTTTRVAALEKGTRRDMRRDVSDAFGSKIIEEAKAEAVKEAKTAAVEAKGLEQPRRPRERGRRRRGPETWPLLRKACQGRSSAGTRASYSFTSTTARPRWAAPWKLKRKDLARAPRRCGTATKTARSPAQGPQGAQAARRPRWD